jgi:uncharacterized protein
VAVHHRIPDVGFHAGELSVQRRAGVDSQAARLARMLQPVHLDSGIAAFLADRSFAALTGRDTKTRLWISPLVGSPGFLRITSPTILEIAAEFQDGDPLHGLPADQRVGLVVVDFAARRRVRVNGTLVHVGHRLVVDVEQAFGNCPQYIQERELIPVEHLETETTGLREGVLLSPEDAEQIRSADTFFLGTAHPERGSDASHRGGPAGFVRVERSQLWWPDYAGNDMFNSFGNLSENPEAALLFPDFATRRTVQLAGTAEVDWGQPGRSGDDGLTGRLARFYPRLVVSSESLALRQTTHSPYPRNPPIRD